MTEEWRPVVGWEGLYEVSDQGRVRSLARKLPDKNGRVVTYPGKILTGTRAKRGGYPAADLRGPKTRQLAKIHRLVCEAFHGPAPEGKPLVLHRNDVPDDNRAENLYWGDSSDNARDRVTNGNAKGPPIKHFCPRGHEKVVRQTPAGTYRYCPLCTYDTQKRNRLQGISAEDKRHGSVRGYWAGCRCRECTTAASDYAERNKKERG